MRKGVCWMLLLLTLLVLPVSSLAAEGRKWLPCTLVGKTQEGNILRADGTPMGKGVYFLSIGEPGDRGLAYLEDVNFDGVEDVVTVYAMGASNEFFDFYVWNGTDYTLAFPYTGDRFGNYQLYPALGMVITHTNDGWAGALHETVMYRWQGAKLNAIRVGTGTSERDPENAEQSYPSLLRVQVYIPMPYGERRELMNELVRTEELNETDYESSVLGREEAMLWMGLR